MAAKVTYDGNVYHHAFSAVMPPLPEEDFRLLKEAIQKDGLQQAVTVIPHWERDKEGQRLKVADNEFDVVDGWNRVKALAKIGEANKGKWNVLDKDTTDDQCENLAVMLNLARRQLSKPDRTRYIKGLLAKGVTYREIAKLSGTPRSTVARVAKGTSTRNTTPRKDSEGKVKPFKNMEKDKIGVLLPNKELVEAFADGAYFAHTVSLLETVEKNVTQLGQVKSGAGDLLNTDAVSKALGAIIKSLSEARPAYVCPKCQGKGQARDNCGLCQGRGWINETIWKQQPASVRESQAALAKQQADDAKAEAVAEKTAG